jgi:hypothetical protein
MGASASFANLSKIALFIVLVLHAVLCMSLRVFREVLSTDIAYNLA